MITINTQLLNHLTSLDTTEKRIFFKDRKIHANNTLRKSLLFINFLSERNNLAHDSLDRTDILFFFVDEWWKHLNLFFQTEGSYDHQELCTYIFQDVLSEEELKSVFSFTPFLMTYLCYSNSFPSVIKQLNNTLINNLEDDTVIEFGAKTFFQLTEFDANSLNILNSLNHTNHPIKAIDCITKSYFSFEKEKYAQIKCFSQDKKNIDFETVFLLFNLCRWQEDLSCESLVWFTT